MAVQSANTPQPAIREQMLFRKPWRAYQANLLDNLDRYLDDGRLHLVAAPGSGKTVLGLEVIRRISVPTLVLAPTITIRDQWVDRLVELFLPQGRGKPDWVTTDLQAPCFLTVTTYQALHSALTNGLEDHQIPEGHDEVSTLGLEARPSEEGEKSPARSDHAPQYLVDAKFGAVVLDEAHHLRTEWWKTLTSFVEHLEHPTIVALTATPPYDVSPFEWNRYEELCGPVDAEVSVPELVLQGDLCPHQDFVYFSAPDRKEQQVLSQFRASVDAFVSRLKLNVAFAEAVRAHPWLSAPNLCAEEILDDPEYCSSMVVYLNGVGQKAPAEVLSTLGLPARRIPELNLEWLEILLSNCLYPDTKNFKAIEPALKDIRHELLGIGAIERRRVTLRDPSDHLKLLTTSVTKLNSVQEIVKLESKSLGDRLRCVVLTDFIRKADLPKPGDEACEFEDIGIVPVFETLRVSPDIHVRIGVLSGSLVIVPKDAEPMIRESGRALGIDPRDLTISPMAHDPSFSRIEIHGEYYRGAVRLITSVFEKGCITTLIGTKSLLGEGWDAPCINTLILASFVGSFMLSNQMRGRAIRVDSAQPQKTANIWHLVCAEPGIFGPGDDYALLVRRCSAFVGVGAEKVAIESGIERLGFGSPPFTREQIAEINTQTCQRALNRAGLRDKWREALAAGSIKQMTDGLKTPREFLPRGFVFANTIAALFMQSAFVLMAMLQHFARPLLQLSASQNFLNPIVTFFGIAAAVASPWTLIALWRLLRHGTPERSIRQIGRAILEALENAGELDQKADEFRVYADRNDDGTVFCSMFGGTGKEQSIFLRALREVLSPFVNPRYLLARRKFWHFFREDYFAVPEVLGRKKEFAEFFAQRWSRLAGPVQLVFTRTPEGRKLLLRARNHSLAAVSQDQSERVSCWK